jgi:hypothetical protein
VIGGSAPGAASAAVAAPVGAGVGRPSDAFANLIIQADLSPGVMRRVGARVGWRRLQRDGRRR